jgi:hypothetical protein
MDQIVQMLAQKFNLSPQVSQQVVSFLLEQLKSRLPEGMGSQLDALMAGGTATASSSATPTDTGGLMDKVKSMAAGLTKKE